MDASQSALDSLRTVEFRETLKGYHRDDVDEYLEKAAVEAEGLQEQLRQNTERLRKAAETIAQLETDSRPSEDRPSAPPPSEPSVADDTLQRTLLLAQRFVDETKADAEAQAGAPCGRRQKARLVTEQAEVQGTQDCDRVGTAAARGDRAPRSRTGASCPMKSRPWPASSRAKRNRLRSALGEMLKWVDDNVRPHVCGHRPAWARRHTDRVTGAVSGAVPGESRSARTRRQAGRGGRRSDLERPEWTDRRDTESPPGGVITRTASTDAPLPSEIPRSASAASRRRGGVPALSDSHRAGTRAPFRPGRRARLLVRTSRAAPPVWSLRPLPLGLPHRPGHGMVTRPPSGEVRRRHLSPLVPCRGQVPKEVELTAVKKAAPAAKKGGIGQTGRPGQKRQSLRRPRRDRPLRRRAHRTTRPASRRRRRPDEKAGPTLQTTERPYQEAAKKPAAAVKRPVAKKAAPATKKAAPATKTGARGEKPPAAQQGSGRHGQGRRRAGRSPACGEEAAVRPARTPRRRSSSRSRPRCCTPSGRSTRGRP